MIQGFVLPLVVGGQARAAVVRELSAAEFFQGYPESTEATTAVRLARLRWEDGVLCRALTDPVVTPETLPNLGHEARAALLTAYFAVVGWESKTEAPPVEVVALSASPAALSTPTLPPASWRAAVITTASRFGHLPMQVWRLPISEFLFTAKLLVESLEEEIAAQERALMMAEARARG